MSRAIFIPRDGLHPVLDRLSAEMDVWVPVASGPQKCGSEFVPYVPGTVPVLERQSTTPPKRILLPQVESLLSYAYVKDPEDASRVKINLQAEIAAKPTVVFGARPCDVRGFLLFDRVFTGGPFQDEYYRKRRENTFFATLVCRQWDAACFCSSVGSGPADMEGSDLRLTPLEDGFLVEAINRRAHPILKLMGGEQPTKTQLEAAENLQKETTEEQVGTGDLTHSGDDFRGRFEDREYWRSMVSQCISCGVCTFVCPTCYCFSITDEMQGLEGERLRSWDSCMFYQYTLEASGHNPRPSKFERYRNRIGHKFSFIPAKYAGMIGCCGCGRCIRSCPVSIDIRKVVENLKENACACS